MKLKDIKINAEDLLKFFNEHVSFENIESNKPELHFKMMYKIRISDFNDFLVAQANKCEKENKEEDKPIPIITKCGQIEWVLKRYKKIDFLNTHNPQG